MLVPVHRCSRGLTCDPSPTPQDKKGQVLDASDWEMCMPGVRAPQQNNGSDCGVFTLMFADCLARGISPLEDATGRNAFPECLVRHQGWDRVC